MQTKKILFSIIIPYFSKKLILSRCLDKLLYQKITKEYYEIIIIDDGSKHDLNSLIQKFKKSNLNLKLFKLAKNRGPGIARNKGVTNLKQINDQNYDLIADKIIENFILNLKDLNV